MNYYPNFATLLNHYLHQADDRSASWLAKKLELHPSTVNKWLNGNSRPRTPEVVIRIADILNVYHPAERQKLLHAAGYGYQMANDSVNLDDSDDLVAALPMLGRTVANHKPAPIDLQKSFVPSLPWKMWYKTFLGNYMAATTLSQQQSLLLVSLASGVMLLYLLFSKYLLIRPSTLSDKF